MKTERGNKNENVERELKRSMERENKKMKRGKRKIN